MLAGIGGLVLLTLAGVRIVRMVEDSTEPTTASSVVGTSTSVTTTSSAGAPVTSTPGTFVTVSDDSESISIAVPVGWRDVSGSGWEVDGRDVGPAIVAAPDIDNWIATWGTPGVFVGVSITDFFPELGDFSSVCTVGKAAKRAVGLLSGTVQSWSRCGEEASDFYVFVGSPIDSPYVLLVQLVSVDGTGLDALDQIMATFSHDL